MLSACGVPTDPEKGPVILLCVGTEVNGGANGEVVRSKRRELYRIDGVTRTIETWDDRTQNFGARFEGLEITSTEMHYSREDPELLAGISSRKTIDFDRIAGTVTDEFAMSNGGNITFTGSCKPVKDAASAKKF